MANNGPNKTVFAARNRVYAMVDETIVYTGEAAANVVAADWRNNSEYDMVRVTSFKYGKRPDRAKGEKQAIGYAVRAYAR